MNIKKLFSRTLDDITYIKELHHIEGVWHQYDFVLDTQIYGWDYILGSADYMIKLDFDKIETISLTPTMGAKSIEYVKDYESNGNNLLAIQPLQNESSMLGIGGFSKALKLNPVKIVWINQTNVIRIMTPINNEDLLTRYMETIIRRTFHTKDEMKLGKPLNKKG